MQQIPIRCGHAEAELGCDMWCKEGSCACAVNNSDPCVFVHAGITCERSRARGAQDQCPFRTEPGARTNTLQLRGNGSGDRLTAEGSGGNIRLNFESAFLETRGAGSCCFDLLPTELSTLLRFITAPEPHLGAQVKIRARFPRSLSVTWGPLLKNDETLLTFISGDLSGHNKAEDLLISLDLEQTRQLSKLINAGVNRINCQTKLDPPAFGLSC